MLAKLPISIVFPFLFLLFSTTVFALPIADTTTIESQIESENVIAIKTDSSAITALTAVIKPTKFQKEAEINVGFYINLLIDLSGMFLIIGTIYYPNYKKLDTLFTFVLFNVVIYLLTFLLNQVKISMGAAFGLFAVFSMLRYRTAGISVKDMTYLFVFIAMGLVSGIQLQFLELTIVFAIIFAMVFLFDTKLLIKREATKIIFFDDIEMIHTDKRQELIEELVCRTGLVIHRLSIDEISYLRDCATITVYYYEE